MPAEIVTSLPLTFLQSGILFHALRDPRTDVYVEQLSCTLQGHLDEEAFSLAWQHLVDRHDALRVAISRDNPVEPVQVVHPEARMPIEVLDWSGWDPSRQAVELELLRTHDRDTPFDLTTPPLMRATLVRLGGRQRALLWTHHHIILDGWSVALVVQDLLSIYVALASGRPPALAPPSSFEPFVRWLHRRDTGAALAYWEQKLRGFETPTIVPPDTDATSVAERVRQLHVRLDETHEQKLRALTHSYGCTPFTAVAAAWSLVLSSVANQRDVLFGATVSGRPCSLPNVESMVGLFINTIPFRVAIDPDELVHTWLRRLEDDKQAATDQHAHVSLVDVLKQLPGSATGLDRVPFNTLVVYENFPLPPSLAISPDLAVENIHCVEKTNFDVTLLVTPSPRFELTLTFDPRRHSTLGMRRLLGRLRATLERLCHLPAHRESCVRDLLEPSGAERHRLLLEYGRGTQAWVGTASAASASDVDVDRSDRIEQAIWASCERRPEAIALSFGNVQWTYGYLYSRALEVADRLSTIGVGLEDRVGLCVHRGPWLVAGALGVMEAGACYVPIDVSWPPERRRRIARDAGLKAVLIDEGMEGTEWDECGVVAVCVGTTGAGARVSRPSRVSAVQRPRTERHLAYVIYTSGSTGEPKGVMLEHAGVVNRLRWMQRAYGLGPTDRVLQKTPATFDVSVWELFWPLMVGARLVLAAPEGHRDSRYIADTLRTRRIGTVHFVPSMLRAFLDEAGLAACGGRHSRSLRRVICSGEPLSRELADRFWTAARAAGVMPGDGLGLFNLYGPTEASVDVTAWSCEPPHADGGGPSQEMRAASVPIGRPIDGVQVYIVDRQLRPVPAGSVGELCIGGIGVARGYLGRPSLTARHFVPDPFGDQMGARLYCTGDLARWRPDGTLDFIGRADDQVKIRGVRVEPGEVEHVLGQHSCVLAAVVVARTVDHGSQLVAYVVRRSRASAWIADRAALFEWLRQRLPEHLVPADLVDLPDGVPLTAHGKIDRRALPAPHSASSRDSSSANWTRSTPLSPLEETIAEVWGDVLGLAPGHAFHVDDTFFRLGGDSLSSLRAVSRLSACVGVDVPVTTFWTAPTLREAARRIAAALATPRADAGAIRSDGDLRAAPLSSAQQRLWLAHHLDRSGVRHNVSCAVWLDGRLDEIALEAALNRLVDRHESLRTEFAVEDGTPVQRPLRVARIELRRTDLADPPDQIEGRCRALALEQIRTPFDLRCAPLIRATLLRCGPERNALALTLHHIVCDGWSCHLLIRDLCAMYEALSAGREPVLPVPPIRYVDFARWQVASLSTPEAEERLGHWMRRLQGAPTDHGLNASGGSEVVDMPAVSVARCLSPAAAEQLRAMRKAGGCTTFMLVLAGFKAVLHDLTGRTDIVIGTDATDRSLAGSWDVVGFFINQLALRTSLASDPSFSALVERVRATCVDGYAHQDVPYDSIVKQLGPGLGRDRALFQVKLVQQLGLPLAFDVGPLHVRPLHVSEPSTEFDLILNFAEHEDTIVFEAEFRADRFSSARVASMLARFERTLAVATANPAYRLSEIGRIVRSSQPLADGVTARRRRVVASPSDGPTRSVGEPA